MYLPKKKRVIKFRGCVKLANINDTKKFFEHTEKLSKDFFSFPFEDELHVEGVLLDGRDEEELYTGFDFDSAEFEFTDGEWRFWRTKFLKNEDCWYGDAGSVVYNNDIVYALFAGGSLNSIHTKEEEASKWCELCNASLDRTFNVLPAEFHG